MREHISVVRTRFSETDAAGHVSHISFFIYLEEARLNFFKDALKIDLENEELHLILASTKCDFRGQAFFNQKLEVASSVSRIGTKSFDVRHVIKDSETGDMITSGSASIVYFNFATQKSEPIPAELRGLLEEYLVD